MNLELNLTGRAGKFTYIAFDTETTGLWAATHRIVEIGAVKFSPKSEKYETFQHLINPERPMPEEVIEIHGITDAMVAEAETAESVLKKFIEFCGDDSILIAHNAPFDISFVAVELERTDLKFGENLILDTVDIYHRFHSEFESYSLLGLARSLNIADSQNHRALADAQLVRQLFIKAIDKFPTVNKPEDFIKFLTTYTMLSWKSESVELPEKYQDIQTALEKKLPLEIVYANPGRTPQPRVVHPIALNSLGSLLYLSAFCEKAGAERTFRLDRIVSFKIL